MSYKEKAVRQLRKGYSPIPAGPNEELNSIFKNIFKKFVDRNDLDFFFEIFDTDETLLRAWSFLGLYYILKDKPIENNEKILRLRKIIIDLLRDERKINYFSSSIETQSSLREHHISRICELDRSIIFEPILEYIQSLEITTDEIVGELLESVLSKVQDSRIEPLILQHAQNVNQQDFSVQLRVIKAFRNLYQNSALKEKDSITKIFKVYLKYIEDDKSESDEVNERVKLNIIHKKRKLKENIFKVAAELGLDLQKETFEFIDALKTPYNGLKQVAKRFKDNERFKLILLKKLEESDNPTLVKDILISIIILRENIRNWKELITENINKFQLRDRDLIMELEKVNFLSENMLINFLIEAEKWQLEFIREILVNNPETLDNLKKFRNEFINILKSFKKANESWDKYPNLNEKKDLALKILIDLEKKELIEYCLENFINLEDNELRKIALFAIINFGTEDLWLKLKSVLKDNKEAAEFFKKFMRSMERKEWKLYY